MRKYVCAHSLVSENTSVQQQQPHSACVFVMEEVDWCNEAVIRAKLNPAEDRHRPLTPACTQVCIWTHTHSLDFDFVLVNPLSFLLFFWIKHCLFLPCTPSNCIPVCLFFFLVFLCSLYPLPLIIWTQFSDHIPLFVLLPYVFPPFCTYFLFLFPFPAFFHPVPPDLHFLFL